MTTSPLSKRPILGETISAKMTSPDWLKVGIMDGPAHYTKREKRRARTAASEKAAASEQSTSIRMSCCTRFTAEGTLAYAIVHILSLLTGLYPSPGSLRNQPNYGLGQGTRTLLSTPSAAILGKRSRYVERRSSLRCSLC